MGRRSRSSKVGLAFCIMAGLAGGVARAQFFPIQGEIPVNVETFEQQGAPAVAIAPSGEFVIVWHSNVQDGDQHGIFGRWFELDGAAVGGEFQVNLTTSGSQKTPHLDMNADGDFVVVWESIQGMTSNVVGRRFTADGQALGGEFQVNAYIGSYQTTPKVAVRSDGAFVVAWASEHQDGSAFGVFARRYDTAGTPLAAPFQVNTYTTSSQRHPTLDFEDDGDFLVAWEGKGSGSGTQDEIWGRRYSSSGAAQGGEFRLNAHTVGHARPELAIAANSSFVVVWQEYQSDGPSYAIVARRFDASGTPLATEFVVNSYTLGNQFYPEISIEADGDFLITWQSDQPTNFTPDVFAQRFFASGAREGDEIRVNSTRVGVQSRPAVAADPKRPAMVIAWEGYSTSDLEGVRAQRFGGTSVDIDGNGAVEPLEDGILFLRYLFGFRGSTLTDGAVAGNCTRCTAPQIEAFIDSLQ